MTFPNPCPRCGSRAKRHDERRCVACFEVWRPLLVVAARESGTERPLVHQCGPCHYTWTAESEILRAAVPPLHQPSRCPFCGHWWEADRVNHRCAGELGALGPAASKATRAPVPPPRPGRAFVDLLDGVKRSVLDAVADELGQPRPPRRRR